MTLAIGLLIMIGFFMLERQTAEPILPLSMFNAAIGAVVISLACGWMSFGMFQFYVPQLQVASPCHTAHVSRLLTPS